MRDSGFFPLRWGAYITSHLVVLHVHIQNSGAGKKIKKIIEKQKPYRKSNWLLLLIHQNSIEENKNNSTDAYWSEAGSQPFFSVSLETDLMYKFHLRSGLSLSASKCSSIGSP